MLTKPKDEKEEDNLASTDAEKITDLPRDQGGKVDPLCPRRFLQSTMSICVVYRYSSKVQLRLLYIVSALYNSIAADVLSVWLMAYMSRLSLERKQLAVADMHFGLA